MPTFALVSNSTKLHKMRERQRIVERRASVVFYSAALVAHFRAGLFVPIGLSVSLDISADRPFTPKAFSVRSTFRGS